MVKGLGIEDNTKNFGTISLYPVPTSDILNISNPQGMELETLEIYDLSGRLVHTEDLRGMGDVKQIDVRQFAKASYNIRIIGKQGQVNKLWFKG